MTDGETSKIYNMKTIPETLRAQADFIEANIALFGGESFITRMDGTVVFFSPTRSFCEDVVKRFPEWTWTRQSDTYSKREINWIGDRGDGVKIELSNAETRYIPELDDIAPEPLVL